MKVKAFDHIVFNVRDVEVSVVWYTKVLGMDWATEFGIALAATTVLALVLLCWLGGVPETRNQQRRDSNVSL